MADREIDDEDRPRKPRRPRDDDDDEDRPRRRSARADDDEEEEAPSLRDNTVLNMFVPVGASVWAVGSLYLSVLGLLLSFGGSIVASAMGVRVLGLVLPGIGGLLALLAIILGIVAFFVRPKKTTYGSVTGYMRAVLGIIFGLIGLVGAPLTVFFLSGNRF